MPEIAMVEILAENVFWVGRLKLLSGLLALTAS